MSNPELKAGNRIRMEIEGEVVARDRDSVLVVQLPGGMHYFGPASVAAAKITVLPTEWKVGMKAKYYDDEFEIVGAPRPRTDGFVEVALWSDVDGYRYCGVDKLERLP